jgi:holliday junction DNA helicase RuvB
MNEKPLTEQLNLPDPRYEIPLRPEKLDDFIGQDKVKERLSVFIQAARQRKEPLEHILLSGPPGLGKTTLANIIAKEMGANIRTTSGPAIERPGDLAGILTNLEPGDIFFIDEIHRLNHVVEEYLYPAMEDFVLDIILDKGPSARSVRLNLSPFTMIGATTRSGLLSSPMRSRMGMTNRLDYYKGSDLKKIVARSSRIIKVTIDEGGLQEIADRSRGTPRIANCLLRRVRDYAQIKGNGAINAKTADAALRMMDVDERGLDEMDKRIITTIVEKFEGGPVGAGSLAVAIGEEPGTLEEVYEPYLIQQGYIKRTASGRKVTQLGFRTFYPDRKLSTTQQRDLFTN